ncbi:MAG: hypothetical protein ABI920_11240 [Casimicrobiaceae bacterium]
MLDPMQWTRLAMRYGAMALASQRVIDHRLARAAASTPGAMSSRDQAEFTGMFTEKIFAAAEAMQASGLAVASFQTRLASAWVRSMMRPWFAVAPGGAGFVPTAHALRAARTTTSMFTAALPGVMAAGLAPVARRAHANDRRLGRRRGA